MDEMFAGIKARQATRKAQARYRMAVLEGLMAENERHMERIRLLQECRWCKATESPAAREVCEQEFTPRS